MSTPDRINKQGAVVLKSESSDINIVSGGSSTRIYTGSRLQMLAQRQVEVGFGATTVKLESTGDGNYQLTSGYPWDITGGGGNSALPVSTHELDFDMEQVSVYNSDNMRAQLLTAFGSQAGVNGAISFLKANVTAYEAGAGDNAAQTAAELKFNVYSGGTLTLMLNLFRGIAYHKVTDCLQFNTIYKRRITSATYNQITASFKGAGEIWTTAEVVAFENIPSAWWFQLPINYQWFKLKPQVLTVANQKTEISYSYKAFYEAWSGIHTAFNAATLLSF